MTLTLFNEHDPNAAAWLRELVSAEHLPAGEVDERSIEDVRPDDLAGLRAAHFFAGIGGWPHALRLAGWPDDAPVWTGSCPCQPYSSAGAGAGDDDPRALWWAWRWLIDQCRPPVLFGEQVASKAGRTWLAAVRADLEAMGYVVGAADLCAAGIGAPHIRQRLFFGAVRLVNADSTGSQPRSGAAAPARHGASPLAAGGDDRRPAAHHGGWTDANWLGCRDGKFRPVEPGTQQMVDGLSIGVGSMRSDTEAYWRIANAAKAVRIDDQILQAVREGNAPQAVWGSLGGCVGLPEATVLLSILCEQSRELGSVFYGATSRSSEVSEDAMRAMWGETSPPACAPQERQLPRQLTWQLGDTLSELSQESTLDRRHIDAVAQFTGSPLADGLPARVVRLRGYGNAIVPQLAALFVEEFCRASALIDRRAA